MPLPVQNKFGNIIVSQQTPDPKFSFAFDPFLYSRPAHLQLQPYKNLRSFYLLDHNALQIIAQLHVFVDGNMGLSPFRGHFGSVQCVPKLSPELASFFLQEVLAVLERENLKLLQIVHYPFCYAPEEASLLSHIFLQVGFTLKSSQINHHIPVTEAYFSDGLHTSARRRLDKCRKNLFRFENIPANQLTELYAFILECRKERGIGLSLSLDDLQELFNRFPDNYLLFGVRDGEKLAAATVAVKVNNSILYNFYPASPLAYNSFSPVVMLNEGLYDFCFRNSFQILDLGISAKPGEEHFPLMQFKQRLGGIISNKFIFEFSFPDKK